MGKDAHHSEPAMPRAADLALRGLVGFGLGGIVAFMAVWFLPLGPVSEFLRMLVVFPASGALGGAVLASGSAGRPSGLSAAFSFGVGFLVAAGSMPLAFFLRESGILAPAATPIGFAVGFGAAGMFGAGLFSWQAAAAGLLCFGVSGAVGGLVIAQDIEAAGVLLIGFAITYALGGGALGAVLSGLCGAEELRGDDHERAPSPDASQDTQDVTEQ
ncbi:MAG: hypothetical protein R6X33_11525 [Candidatus Brocadiia bacterium]